MDLSGEDPITGVVRKPMPWVHESVDDIYPDLDPPVDLLQDIEKREDDFKRQGIYDAAPVTAAWADFEFTAGTGRIPGINRPSTTP